jgi:steroid 5-alpha reductase family enzyme
VPDFLIVAGLSLAVAVVVMTLTALVAARTGRVSVVDTAWGVALLAVAVGCAVWSGTWQSWMLVALVGVWAGRLSSHIFTRSRGHGEDPRYLAVLGGPLSEVGMGVAVRRVFLVQGAAVWLVSLPLQAAAVAGLAWTWVVWLGVAVWLVGALVESVGDAQLSAYKRDPERGPVMDRGLWAWSRHPNYFGDSCVWWGIWTAGGLASGWLAGLASVVAPVAMTVWLVWLTGARLLERTMMKRPGYPEYAARTSMFVPLPPRRRCPGRTPGRDQ